MAGGKLSAVLNFGAKVLPSARAATDELDKRVARVGKTMGKLEAAQKAVRREMRSAPKGEQYDALARRADHLKSRIEGVRREQERLARSQRGRERLSSLFDGAKEAAGSFATMGLTAIATGATAAIGGVLALTHATAAHGREITVLSRRTGVSTRQLQAYGFAAQRTGTDLETVVDATKTFQEKIAEATRDRRGGSADMLKRIGLDPTALASMHPDEQLGMLADAMAGVANQADRTRIATEVMGDAGLKLIPMLDVTFTS